MAPKPLLDIFKTHIDDRSAVFVFPSAVPAHFWLRQLCEMYRKPLALERFIAWDEFKEHCLSLYEPDQKPANSLSRMLFASHILEENAQDARAGSPLFKELLPPEHASDYAPFISHVGQILPSLQTIIERTGTQTFTSDSPSHDPYFMDLRSLYHRYRDFLVSHGLYEPDWVRSPFSSQGKTWVLLFPDLADDWEAYAPELSQAPSVHIYTVQDIQIDESPGGAAAVPVQEPLLKMLNRRLLQFSSVREEIRYVANLLAYLVHNKLLGAEDIALSIPDLEHYGEALLLECRLRSLPMSIRQGKAITDQSGGRLFSHLQDCYQSRWSYRALKNLLTDRALPWKDMKLIEQFLSFGLTYRCLSGYEISGSVVDVWEETFTRLLEQKLGTPYALINLKQFYRQLKRDIVDIVTAKSFETLQDKLMYFAGNHFDRSRMSEETDRVYARAIEELGCLIETEKYLADCSTGRAFPLLLTHLKNTTYVHQSEDQGIAVYPYRVAAGIAPKLHIIMNAIQEAISVLVDPAPFLREDRKRSLDVSSIDRSESFITAYGIGPVTIFTAPERGFTGYAIPHQGLTAQKSTIPPLEDRYKMEETRINLEKAAPFSIQYEAWKRSQRAQRPYSTAQDIRKAPINMEALREALYTRLTTKKAPHHISPTDINRFITCPFQWLLTQGLGIAEPQLEIETIGQKDIGILYHAILEAFFNQLQAEPGKRIHSNELERYKMLMQTLIRQKLDERRSGEGAFQESVYEMLFERIQEHLFAYLETEIPNLNSCAVLGPEYPLRRKYPELGIYLAGKADLILMNNNGNLIILDFKTGKAPQKRELWPDAEGLVSNFQIAAYIRMAENQLSASVSHAAFYSIEERKTTRVIDPEGPTNRSPLPVVRTGYEPVITKLDETLAVMVEYLKTGRYPVVEPANRSICASCAVKAVCRINFSGGDKE